jgi:hypothetical protein
VTCCYAASDIIVFSNFVIFSAYNIVHRQKYEEIERFMFV